MKTIILIIILNFLFATNRPSIALVLSGGGAKGISQIATLHVIDSLNIPIDYVIGTSMGALGGALYSIGHSPKEIKNIVFDTDWDLIMFDKKIRKNLSYFQKDDYHKYQLQFTLQDLKPIIPIALNSGHESHLYINQLIRYNEKIDSYDDYVIPFRCNAIDLLTGDEIIFKNGSLAKALRSSSSIPSVFNPVNDNDLLLVDGGILNNLGTDIAKNLGADIIIAVNSSTYRKKKSEFVDVFDVLYQSIQLNALNKKKKNLKLSTILIEPKLDFINTLDFNFKTLETIYSAGHKATYDNIQPLINIKNNLPKDTESSYLKLSSIPSDSINISSISVQSQSSIKINELFNYILPKKISKSTLINQFSFLRKSNIYNNINYYFLKNEIGYELIIELEKNYSLIINNVFIQGNNKISTSFLKDIINISNGDVLENKKIDEKIFQLYSLDYFESIRYELINLTNNSTDIKFIFNEAEFKRLKIGASWSNYYELIGKIQLDLINKPFNRFRIRNKLFVGNSMKENYLNLLYTGNYTYTSKFIPLIKIINKKSKASYYDNSNQLVSDTFNKKQEGIGILFPFTHFGYLEVGINQQKIQSHNHNKEKSDFYSIELEIDQLDDILYPSEGFKIFFYKEKSSKDTIYTMNKISFDQYTKLASKSSLRLYGDFLDSQNLYSVYKNINYFKVDRMLINSEYNLYSSDLLSYGIELNYLYKNSQTIRFLIHKLDKTTLNHNNQTKNNLISYGIGLRIKSILGPINLLWTESKEGLFDNDKQENYYFSIGIDY